MKKVFIDKISAKQKQWLWFFGLWVAGFFVMLALSKVIKLLMLL